MFRANIRAMNNAADEIRQQLRKLGQQIGNLEDVRTGLSGLSGMEGVRRQLQKEMEALEAEQRTLRQLLTALQQAVRCYDACERSNLSYAEDNRYRTKRVFGWVEPGSVVFPKGISITLNGEGGRYGGLY